VIVGTIHAFSLILDVDADVDAKTKLFYSDMAPKFYFDL
jgi:hypothetical protein